MRPLTFWALLLLPAAILHAGQIDAPVSGELSPGAQTGAIGTALGAPSLVQLTVPSLMTAGAPNLAALTPTPLLLAPAVQPASLQAASLGQAIQPLPVLPASALTPELPHALGGPLKPAPSAEDPAGDEKALARGSALFDQSSAKPSAEAPSFWAKLRESLPFGERAPAWPGKAGETVRVGRIKTTLSAVIGQGGTSTVWKSADRNFAIKLLHPGTRALPGVADEASILRALAGSDLPVAKLLAESRDGSVLVKELIEGETATTLLGRGPLSRTQAEGLTELAAKLIASGVTADLASGNLVWQHWRTRWMIVDAGGLKDGDPGDVLAQLMAPDVMARAGLDPAAFLAGLRARLGPDTAAWAKTLAALRGLKAAAEPLKALGRRDAAAPAGPDLVFGPSPKGPAGLDDTFVNAGDLKKRVGYDPMLSKKKFKLHGDDPGKLNTVILSVVEPGKTPVVVKIAQLSIIRNEIAVRRLARRFFGRYARVPASVAVESGYESYMVMQKLDASPDLYKDSFTLEQRVAMALLARTFGLGDVNQGNVLAAHDGGPPWLIDFEVAFGRAAPFAGRLPDERIALEMPWMSLHSRNRVEDYQPGIRAWRALLAKPQTRAAILSDLAAAGFEKDEAASLLALFDRNAADLDWTLQNDADFVNQFVERKAAQR